MKQSRFNSIIPIDSKWSLLYNAMADAYLCADPLELNKALQSIGTEEPLYGKLLEIGAVIEDDCDEIAMVKERIDKADHDMSYVQLHINPTLQCNFSCWYCYEDHSGKSKMAPSTIDAVVKLAERRLSHPEVKQMFLSFFGGEPLLYFNDVARIIISRIKELTEKREIPLSVHFTSNAYLITEEMLEFFRDLNVSFQITLDGYRETHDKVRFHGNKGSYDIIVRNVRSLLSIGKHVVLRINYTSQSIDTVPKIFEEISGWSPSEKECLSVDLQQVWQDISKVGIGNGEVHKKVIDLMEYGTRHDFKCTSPSGVSGIGRSCYADKANHILVNWNGDLFFCTARDFKPESRKGYLDPDGMEVWENDSYCRHMSVKFSKPVCQNCRIGAMCLGGCRQKGAETQNGPTCPLGYTEDNINHIILGRFERLIVASATDTASETE